MCLRYPSRDLDIAVAIGEHHQHGSEDLDPVRLTVQVVADRAQAVPTARRTDPGSVRGVDLANIAADQGASLESRHFAPPVIALTRTSLQFFAPDAQHEPRLPPACMAGVAASGGLGRRNRVRSRGVCRSRLVARGAVRSQRRFAKELWLSSHFVASVGYVPEATLRRSMRVSMGRGGGVRRAYAALVAAHSASACALAGVWNPPRARTTPRCRNGGMRGRAARPASTTAISPRS